MSKWQSANTVGEHSICSRTLQTGGYGIRPYEIHLPDKHQFINLSQRRNEKGEISLQCAITHTRGEEEAIASSDEVGGTVMAEATFARHAKEMAEGVLGHLKGKLFAREGHAAHLKIGTDRKAFALCIAGRAGKSDALDLLP